MPVILCDRMRYPCEVKMRDALVVAHNSIYFALPPSRQMGPTAQVRAAQLLRRNKKPLNSRMRLAFCAFCVAALEGECSLENAAVRFKADQKCSLLFSTMYHCNGCLANAF